MWCYFFLNGRNAGVEALPSGLSDKDAIARAHTLLSKRKGPFDGFEVWDGARLILRHPDPFAEKPDAGQPGQLPDGLRQPQDDVAVALTGGFHLR